MKSYIKELMYYIFAGLMLWYCIIIISDGVRIKEAMISAVENCMNVIIPSLFAFMAASGIIVSSGAYVVLSKPFALISKYVLSMPAELFSVFLISNIAGYPVGAKLLCDLCDKGRIDKKTAGTMQCFCYASGPAFVSSVVGLALYGSVKIGMVVFLSCALSNTILAAVMCRLFPLKVNGTGKKRSFSPDVLTDPVLSAGRSLFGICALIVFFSSVTAVLDHYRVLENVSSQLGIQGGDAILRCLLEISNLSRLSKAPYALLPVLSGICSFGGVCVILQVFSLTKDRFSLKLFLLTRPIAAALSVVNSLWISRLMLPDEVAASAGQQQIFVKVNNFVPSVCLILMIFLLKIKKRVAFSE